MISIPFLAGLVTATFVVCSLFFLRFWSRTKDVLFAGFALTFFLLALGETLTIVFNLAPEERTWIYLLRMSAFVILIIAIIRKNVGR